MVIIRMKCEILNFCIQYVCMLQYKIVIGKNPGTQKRIKSRNNSGCQSFLTITADM
jgi:hypothetical protein